MDTMIDLFCIAINLFEEVIGGRLWSQRRTIIAIWLPQTMIDRFGNLVKIEQNLIIKSNSLWTDQEMNLYVVSWNVTREYHSCSYT